MSRCKLRTPWPIHFKLRTAIGIDSLTVCILFGEISIFSFQSYGTLFTNSCTINMNWNIYTYDTFFEKSVKTINSNNSTKFEVNWPRGSQFTARHTDIVWMLTTGVSCALGTAVYFYILLNMFPSWILLIHCSLDFKQ
jgi:hypothetical protein